MAPERHWNSNFPLIEMIHVSIIEDHKGQRQSLEELLNTSDGLCCIGSYASAEVAMVEIPKTRPDVVLVDLHLPGKSGIIAIKFLKQALKNTQFLMLTIEDGSSSIFQAIEAGAVGYLLKRYPPSKVLQAIREVVSGGVPMSPKVARLVVQAMQGSSFQSKALSRLTPRETEVLRSLAKGLRYKEIASELGIKIGTVEGYIKVIYEKLQVHSAIEATKMLNESRFNK